VLAAPATEPGHALSRGQDGRATEPRAHARVSSIRIEIVAALYAPDSIGSPLFQLLSRALIPRPSRQPASRAPPAALTGAAGARSLSRRLRRNVEVHVSPEE
jgi:hypothetical protein